MADGEALTYHAFITHARADAGWAKWLHRRLEGFDVWRALSPSGASAEQFPRWLRPIFRGQEKSPRAQELGYEGVAALYGSAALIVVCSPASAKSPYVSECVRLFKTRYPERLVIPVIVGGEPGGGSKECYPQALRYRRDSHEQFIAAPAGLLSVDFRPGRDSREAAVAKIAARMLGVSQYELSYPDDSNSEEGRERRSRSGVRNLLWLALSAAVVIGVLNSRDAINSAFDRKRHALAEVDALVERLGEHLGEPKPAPKSAPQAASQSASASPSAPASGDRVKESLRSAVAAIVEGASADRRQASVLEFLNQGKSIEAQAVLRALAEEEAAKGAPRASKAAAIFHRLGIIASLDSPELAQDALSKAVQLQPANIELLRDLSLAYAALAEHYVRAGSRPMAAMALREGKSAAERVLALAPADAVARDDLAWFSKKLTEFRPAEHKPVKK